MPTILTIIAIYAPLISIAETALTTKHPALSSVQHAPMDFICKAPSQPVYQPATLVNMRTKETILV